MSEIGDHGEFELRPSPVAPRSGDARRMDGAPCPACGRMTFGQPHRCSPAPGHVPARGIPHILDRLDDIEDRVQEMSEDLLNLVEVLRKLV